MSEQDGGSLVYQVDIETAKMITGSRKASIVLEEMQRQTGKASKSVDALSSSADKAGNSMGGLKTVLTGVASAISVSLIIDYGKAFLTVADNITQLQARIARLTSDTSTAKSTFMGLATIASNTGSSLKDTAKLWETMTASLKETGATNSQILALTDTLQKIGRVGGSSSEEMANALRQFGQSIASGTVRAEEFNSIVEQMPELARQIAVGLGMTGGQLRQAMLEGKLSAEDAINAIMKQSDSLNEEFKKLPRTMDQASNTLTISLQMLIGKMNETVGASQTMVTIIDSISSAIDRLSGKTETAAQRISDLTSTAEMYERRARTWSWLGVDGWSEQNKALAVLSHRAATLVGDLDSVAQASARAAAGQIKFNNTGSNNKQDALIKKSERSLALSKLEGEARARLAAQYAAEDAGFKKDDPRTKRMEDEAAATYRNIEAQKKFKSETKSSATAAESVAQKVENLRKQSELAADSASEWSREQAILNAQLSLGKGATQAQIAEAGAYAAKKWDTANAIKAQAAAEKLLPEAKENASYAQDVKDLNTALAAKKISQEQYNTTAEQLEQQHQVNLAKIRAKAVVSPQQQAAGMVDPVQQLANENAQKLALIQQFETDKGKITQRGIELMNAANKQYEQQRTAAQWEILSQQSLGYDMLTSAVDAFSGNASNAITGLLTGTMSAQEAMRSLGNTILNSVINSIVQVGVEALKNYILGQTLGAASVASSVGMAATTASAWAPAAAMASLATLGANAAPAAAGITSTVGLAGGLALAGARYNGGPVSAGAMYPVGERGKPEIYQASTGKQYMIPGDNGKVISNKQITGGGSAAPTIIIENYSSGAGVMDTQASKGADGADVVRIVLADLQQGGQISQGISQYHQAPRKATE
ncbi:Phage-related minor tail protein [Serratia marcescens]|nr:tape measure protein [Serratia marcescens]CUY44488.1 Phage-related minor tail protein [Serratia marcescens]CUY97250.1 Phage-related minor tail protein [Serratia marcescens]CVA70806.1 Phage-related minor tail protein [Serratia marcescens]CVA73440.1 Phage-related minor tail protein [Serratia marcescens]CVB60722.1 Phage-related minor tail protein [Serratia marcescens]